MRDKEVNCHLKIKKGAINDWAREGHTLSIPLVLPSRLSSVPHAIDHGKALRGSAIAIFLSSCLSLPLIVFLSPLSLPSELSLSLSLSLMHHHGLSRSMSSGNQTAVGTVSSDSEATDYPRLSLVATKTRR